MLTTLLSFAIAIGLLVTIHELGHYGVARWCGVYIERFSIGFGKVLVQRTDKRGCQWALSALPLGGYVKMREQDFEQRPLRQRVAIVAAGPIANLLLAVLLYAAVGIVGSQEPAAILAQPETQTAAYDAGLQEGDTVVAVNHKAIQSWSQLRWQLLDTLHTGGEVALQVRSLGESTTKEKTLHLAPSTVDPTEGDPMQSTGLALSLPQPSVRDVVADSAAEQAGLQPNDTLVAINETPIHNAGAFVEYIQQHAGQTIDLHLEREGTEFVLAVTVATQTNDQGQKVGQIGVLLGANIEMVNVRYGPIASVSQGVSRTIDTFWLSLKMISRMVTGEVSVKNISGPVSIADYAGQSARIGLSAYLSFLALVSVSIGLLNLLPIPMLDGGHLLYYAIEGLTGRPVSDSIKLIGQRIGISVLIALTFLALFNDVARLY